MIDQTYPIISSIVPSLSSDEWRSVCRRSRALQKFHDDDSTQEMVAIAQSSDDYVKGLCVYSVRRISPYGPLLDVPVFFAASAVDAEGVAAEMLNYLWSVGERLDLNGLRIWNRPAEFWHARHDPSVTNRTDIGVFMPREVLEKR